MQSSCLSSAGSMTCVGRDWASVFTAKYHVYDILIRNGYITIHPDQTLNLMATSV